MDELQVVVNLNLPGIVCIAETWLDAAIGDSVIPPDGFCCFRSDCRDGYGGVCTYVNSHIPCKRLVDFESPDVESLWLTIRHFRLPLAVILLVVVYHPPPQEMGGMKTRSYWNILKIILIHFFVNILMVLSWYVEILTYSALGSLSSKLGCPLV